MGPGTCVRRSLAMVEQLEGTVARIRYTNPESHWTVASLEIEGAFAPITIVGALPALADGMKVRLDGAWVNDPRWGKQFKAERFVELIPATRDGITAYLSSGFIRGVGPKMAERIVDAFGEETLNVIMESPQRLSAVAGLGAKKVRAIEEAFRERRGAQEALVFLYGLGLTPGLASRIVKRYGDQSIALVRSNPYRLAEEVDGVGFLKADQVARGLEIAVEDPDRLRAGGVHILQAARSEGHCFLPLEHLIEATSHLTGVDRSLVQPALDMLVLDGRVVFADWPDRPMERAVYLTALLDAERRLAERLSELAVVTPVSDPESRIDAAAEGLGLALGDGQRDALRTALSHPLTVVTGGPGTGKTTIIQCLLEAAGLSQSRVALAAPTGRAAKRMSEATGQEAKTIHRLLEFNPIGGRFQRDEADPLDVELLIVDEASMVDLPLFDSLMRAVVDTCRVVLVGDVDQLPPVGPGAPLTELIRSETVPVVRLREIYRQGAGSTIIDVAHGIQRGESPEVTPAGTTIQDFYFIHREDPAAILATMEELVTRRIPSRFGFDPRTQIQVLSPMRMGLLGVQNLNERLQSILNPSGTGFQVGERLYRVGDRVMQIRNDYDRGVFNGDTGTIERVDPVNGRLVVVIDDQPVIYERNQLDELVLAYAVSVHKSQGSEYTVVVMPVTTQHFKMLQRNLLYTGLTRGKRLVVLVGTPKAVGLAVRNQEQSLRNTLLATRLQRLAPSATPRSMGGHP